MSVKFLLFPVACLAGTLAIGGSAAERAHGDTSFVDSLVAAHSWTMSLRDGRLEGPGAEFLLGEASHAQFVAIGEEHNVVEIPEIVTALLRALQTRAGYQYLALEQDPFAMQMASHGPMRGKLDSIVAYAHRYPNGFTFVSDQELTMIAAAGMISHGHGDPVWGLDQSFGVANALDRLLSITKAPTNGAARALAMHYLDSARLKERVRDLDKYHYIANETTEDYGRLDSLFAPRAGSEEAFILDNLAASNRIYRYYLDGRHYQNGYVREELMKRLFIAQYKRAEAADHALPKVVLKMGHWHLYRGEGPSNMQTTGNFVSELARVDGSQSFHVAIHSNNPLEGFRSIAAWSDSFPDPMLVRHLPTNQWTIVDLRPLRENFTRIAPALRGDQRDPFRRLVFGFDAALYVGGMRPATYELNPGIKY